MYIFWYIVNQKQKIANNEFLFRFPSIHSHVVIILYLWRMNPVFPEEKTMLKHIWTVTRKNHTTFTSDYWTMKALTTKSPIIRHTRNNTLCSLYLSLKAVKVRPLLLNCKSCMIRTHSFKSPGLYPEQRWRARLYNMDRVNSAIRYI